MKLTNYKVHKQNILNSFTSSQREVKIISMRAELIKQTKRDTINQLITQIRLNLQIHAEQYSKSLNMSQIQNNLLQLCRENFWKAVINKSIKIIQNQQFGQLLLKGSNQITLLIQSLSQLIACLLDKDLFNQIKYQILKQQKFLTIKEVHVNIKNLLVLFIEKNILCLPLWQNIFKKNYENSIIRAYMTLFLLNVCPPLSIQIEGFNQQDNYNLMLCLKNIIYFHSQKLKYHEIAILLKVLNNLSHNSSGQQLKCNVLQTFIYLTDYVFKKHKTQILCYDLNNLLQMGDTVFFSSRNSDKLILSYIKILNTFLKVSEIFLELIQKRFNIQKVKRLIDNISFYLRLVLNQKNQATKNLSFSEEKQNYQTLNQIAIFIGEIISRDCQISQLIIKAGLGQVLLLVIEQENNISLALSIFSLNFTLKIDFNDLIKLDVQRFLILIQKIINSYDIQIRKNGIQMFLHFLIQALLNLDQLSVKSIFWRVRNYFVFEQIILNVNKFSQEIYLTDGQLLNACCNILDIQRQIQKIFDLNQ